MLKIFLDTDSDFTLEHVKEWGVGLISMPYEFKGKEVKPYVDFEKFDFNAYYEELRKGELPSTSALNPEDYVKYFEPEFKAGNDIFYIHFSASMSGTFNSMRLALDELKEKYPERKFYEFDTLGITLCAYTIGKDMVKMLKEGQDVEKVIAWGEKERQRYATYFFADNLKFFAKSGRVSGIAAFMGGIVGIRPILTMNAEGKMVPVGKVKGRRNAVLKLAEIIEDIGIEFDEHAIVFGHCGNIALAEECIAELKARLGNKHKLTFEIIDVNPTAGAHCGPDTLGVTFRAKHR